VTLAWPFLVGRTKNAGQRIVVAPDYMEAAGSPSRLALLSRGESGPGEAFIADFPAGPEGEPATAIFRVFRALHADYLGPGDEPLTDNVGREIRITEGFIVPLPAAEARAIVLRAEDLAQAHERLAPSYREFWEHEGRYALRYSVPFTLAGATSESSALRLLPVEVSLPGDRAGDLGAGPSALTVLPPSDPPAEAGTAVVRRAARPGRTGRGPASLLAILVGITTFAVIIGVYLLARSDQSAKTGHLKTPASGASSSTSPSATSSAVSLNDSQLATLRAMCTALDAGNISRALSLTTPTYRASHPSHEFSTELIGAAGRVRSCQVGAGNALTGNALMTVTTQAGAVQPWTVTLAGNGDTWEVSSLTRAGK
jgi:hypothetical protein